MKKNILSVLIPAVLCSALFLSGCLGFDNAETRETAETRASAELAEDAVVINGEVIRLTYESNHRNLYYKESVTQFQTNTMGAFCNLTHYKDGEDVVDIRLVYYNGKNISEVMSESDNEISLKTIGDKEYQYFDYEVNGRPGHTYLYQYEDTTYSISFESIYDTASLEAGFMKYVRFGN